MILADAFALPSIARVNILQRLEAAALLGLNLWGFHDLYPHHWGAFSLLFFLPDLALLGYVKALLAAQQAGDLYNSSHSYILPAVMLIAAWSIHLPLVGELALIWTAHISFDRALGYGLKLQDGFRYTHLGLVGAK